MSSQAKKNEKTFMGSLSQFYKFCDNCGAPIEGKSQCDCAEVEIGCFQCKAPCAEGKSLCDNCENYQSDYAEVESLCCFRCDAPCAEGKTECDYCEKYPSNCAKCGGFCEKNELLCNSCKNPHKHSHTSHDYDHILGKRGEYV